MEKWNQKVIKFVPYIFICLIIVSVAIIFIMKNNVRTILSDRISIDLMEKYNLLANYFNENDDYGYEFFSSDESIAYVDKNTGIIQTRKSGEVTIEVKSKKDNKTVKKFIVSVSDTVKASSIKFDKDNYTCNVGDKFNITISTEIDSNTSVEIKNVFSNNTSIALLKDGNVNDQQVECIGCKVMHVECKKEGTTTLEAINNYQMKASATVVVGKNSTKPSNTSTPKPATPKPSTS